MKATIEHKGKVFQVDLSKPLDISIPLNGPSPMVTAWYVEPTRIEPVKMGEWVGSVKSGASVNFNNITFNPHGNGTHTECLGHITLEAESVNEQITQFFFLAEVISVEPISKDEDRLVTRHQVEELLKNKEAEAVVIRTLPNKPDKLHANYSNTNPPYLEEEAASFLCESGVKHLLIDLPSVDREVDKGRLLAHKAFWDIDGRPRMDATITELVYVNNEIPDGTYLLNLQFAPFENDASPGRPLLFQTSFQDDDLKSPR